MARPQSKEIERRILVFLEKQDWPVTSESVAKALGIAWNTANFYLMKLKAEGKVRGKRVGRQNQWGSARKRF